MGRIGALVPEVLRTEAQFRLLFAGQVLSLVGDRVMLVALPFAVLEAGGSIEAVGLVVAAQLVPFLVFALAGGVISDRGDRRRVLIASDVARLIVQARRRRAARGRRREPAHARRAGRALRDAPTPSSSRPSPACCPQTVSHAGQLQPANALRGLSFSISSIARAGDRRRARRRHRSRGGDAVRRRVVRGQRGLPAAAAPGGGESRGSRRPRRPSWPRSWPAGARCARARGSLAGLGAMCAYSGIVLPAVYVLGPVSIAERLGGPERVGGRRRRLRAGLRAGRRAAAAHPPARTRC